MSVRQLNLVERIPHRPPMRWLDEAAIGADGCVTARRYVTPTHPFVYDNFLLPLALIEMLSQTAACGAVAQAGDRIIRRGVLASVRELVFHRPVSVGATLNLYGQKERSMGSLSRWRLHATADACLVVEGIMAFHLDFVSFSGASK